MDEINTQTSVRSTVETPIQSPKPEGHVLKMIITVIVVIIVLGGIAYGANWVYVKSQSGKVTVGTVVSKMMDDIKDSKIKSVEFTASGSADLTGLNSLQAETSMSPAGFPQGITAMNVSMTSNGMIDATVKDNLSVYVNITTEAKLTADENSQAGAMLAGLGKMNLDLEFYLFKDSVYFKINKVPSVISLYAKMYAGIDISKYIGKWMYYQSEKDFATFNAQLKGISQYIGNNLTDDQYTKLKKAIADFYDGGVMNIADRKPETTKDGQSVTALYVNFDGKKMYPASVKLMKDLNEIFANKNGSGELEKMLNDASFKKLLEGYSSNNLKLLVGSDGYLYGSSGTVNIAGSDISPAMSENVDFSLKNYNKSFKLEKPADARNIIEVAAEIQNQINAASKTKINTKLK
ncbi:MAG: hypothetical protein NTV72_02605 [Candidatus Taylorbacteria bacterium]|nr:hypothetical protein [Candidatus Taylorbacteria bacterium]